MRRRGNEIDAGAGAVTHSSTVTLSRWSNTMLLASPPSTQSRLTLVQLSAKASLSKIQLVLSHVGGTFGGRVR